MDKAKSYKFGQAKQHNRIITDGDKVMEKYGENILNLLQNDINVGNKQPA